MYVSSVQSFPVAPKVHTSGVSVYLWPLFGRHFGRQHGQSRQSLVLTEPFLTNQTQRLISAARRLACASSQGLVPKLTAELGHSLGYLLFVKYTLHFLPRDQDNVLTAGVKDADQAAMLASAKSLLVVVLRLKHVASDALTRQKASIAPSKDLV